MKNLVVDISKLPFSDAPFFLRAEFEEFNVLNFEFFSSNIDIDFIKLVALLKGWYSAYIIQKSDTNSLKVTFVTKAKPVPFVERLQFLTGKGGILYV